MVFSSTIFLFLFLPIVLIGYYNPWLKSQEFKNGFLLLASLFFYAWGEPVFVFLMMISIMITWILGLRIDFNRDKARFFLTMAIIYHVAVMFVFKYLGFAASQVGLLIHREINVGIELPIGISFFTFQMMSYLFDVYYKKTAVQKSVTKLALYVALFPQLVAGPIVRYNQVAEEISDRSSSYEDIVIGMKQFIYGVSKKVLLANYVAQVADNVFDYLGNRSVVITWLGAICYTLQIYFDFSGYSDMAIGLGRMFGFHFTENFNYPYISRSVTEFWRRWHISLSSWFRDYVYIPLGGNRVSKKKWTFNLFVVWLLTGIWHGANWTFIVWGLGYFVILLAEKNLLSDNKEKKPVVVNILSWLYTMVIVNFAWVIFRAKDIKSALEYMGNMIGIGANGFYNAAAADYIRNTFVVLIIAMFGATPLFKKFIEYIQTKKIAWIESVWVLLIFVISVLKMISSTYNPFIYFNF